jgi:hypothetical protein
VKPRSVVLAIRQVKTTSPTTSRLFYDIFHTVIIMVTLWFKILTAWFLALYSIMRGPVTVDTVIVPHAFRHITWHHQDGVSHRLIFMCHQQRHVSRYQRWYMPTHVRYSYVVEMTRYRGFDIIDTITAQYPQLCTTLFNRTTWPHRCAVNAFLDA